MGYKIGAALLVLGLAVFSIARAQNNSGGNNDTVTSPVTERTPQVPSGNLLPTDCGQIPIAVENRMYGGSLFPWIALFEYPTRSGKRILCSGALISKRYILTAAHCLDELFTLSNWKLQSVRLGEYNTFDCADNSIQVDIEEQIFHEDYNPNLYAEKRHDIALLRLSRDVAFTDFIKPICLPSTSDIGQTLSVAVWEWTQWTPSSGLRNSKVKVKKDISLEDKQLCGNAHRFSLDESQICAGNDSCNWEPGNPLMQEDRLPDGSVRWSAAGIVSFGGLLCGWPVVYTNVSHYKPWIISKLRP